MYYEVNVALKGKHFFATAPRSITDIDKLKEVFFVLNTKFPESEGYTISVSYASEKHYGVNRFAFANALKSGQKYDLFKLFQDVPQ